MSRIKEYDIVDSVEKLEAALEKVREAQKKFALYTQEQVDAIFLAAASAPISSAFLLLKWPLRRRAWAWLRIRL